MAETPIRVHALLGRHLKDYRRNADRRGIAWHLSQEEFTAIVSLNCHYCGVRPKKLIRNDKAYGGAKIIVESKEKLNGIDRIDSTLGYTLSNCVAACKRCNQGKNNMTTLEFLRWIKKVFLFAGAK